MVVATSYHLPFNKLLAITIRWTSEVIFAMLWSVFVLSGVGISIMFYLLRTGSVTRLTSAMYVVPGLTAIFAWLLFGESLPWSVLAGMSVTLLGIYLVVSVPKKLMPTTV